MMEKFETDLLDSILERKRREQEEFRLQLIKKLFDTLDKLSQEIPFKEAYLFGSIGKPYRFTKESDVDIGFLGLKDEHFFKAMSFISREIGVDVDILQLENHRLAKKIKKEGIKWTKRGKPYLKQI